MVLVQKDVSSVRSVTLTVTGPAFAVRPTGFQKVGVGTLVKFAQPTPVRGASRQAEAEQTSPYAHESGCGFASEQAGGAMHRWVTGSQTCEVQPPGTQGPGVPPSPITRHWPLAGSQLSPEGQLVPVHGGSHCFVAPWQMKPAAARPQSASVMHWQNAFWPAALPGGNPLNDAHVFEESGQSTELVHSGMQRRVTGWHRALVPQFASVTHAPAAPPAVPPAAPPATPPPLAPPAVDPPPVPPTFAMQVPVEQISVTAHARQLFPRVPQALEDCPDWHRPDASQQPSAQVVGSQSRAPPVPHALKAASDTAPTSQIVLVVMRTTSPQRA